MTVHFFLGANGGTGFESLYAPVVEAEENQDVMVLKGGPGVGKSSFMKLIGREAEQAGEEVEYIWCSGDPESLDAVRLPRLGVIAVDGTAPHVVEPRYPAAVDRYVDLGRFYDVEACKAAREEIVACTRRYKAAYARAYHALAAAVEVENAMRERLDGGLDRKRLARRAAGIAAREFGRGGGEKGRTFRRFLGGPTHQGVVVRYDTAAALCPRVYEIIDSCGFAHELLGILHLAATAAGYDVIACPDPNRPDELLHLLVPGAGVAFLSLGERQRFPGETYRRFHLDRLVDEGLQRRNRARLRLQRRVHQALLEEGLDGLREAKAAHDDLEAIYNPTVDFQGVYALAQQEWERIRRRIQAGK